MFIVTEKNGPIVLAPGNAYDGPYKAIVGEQTLEGTLNYRRCHRSTFWHSFKGFGLAITAHDGTLEVFISRGKGGLHSFSLGHNDKPQKAHIRCALLLFYDADQKLFETFCETCTSSIARIRDLPLEKQALEFLYELFGAERIFETREST